MTNHYPQLINDIPSSEDKFDAHQRIAITIANLLKEEQGGKTVSLEGEWGSGKSTVIKILSKSLDSNQDIAIINYDAWTHSGDPLRRAFLDTLIDALLKKGWIGSPDKRHKEKYDISFRHKKSSSDSEINYWQRKKDELSGVFKSTTKTVTPRFKPLGRWLVLSLFLFPIANISFITIINNYLKMPYLFLGEKLLLGLFYLSILLVLSPFIILGIAWKRSKDSDFIFSLLLNKTVVEDESSTIENPDPSSIEFQALFSEVLDMALSHQSRKLVLVIDNLDRLKSEEAESVWTMLRSFIDSSVIQSNQYEWASRLWVIVPTATNEKKAATLSDETTLEGMLGKSNKKTEQFLDKVFQVRFHLPPPVLNNWQSYLHETLVKAFGEENIENQSRLILRLYEGYLQGSTNEDVPIRPTPRSMIHFVNDVVVLKLLWKDQFPLSTLAAYALAAKTNNVLEGLLQKRIPNSRTLRLLGSQVQQDFSAIYFNVSDLKKAQEILLRPVAKTYLKDGLKEKIEEELKSNPYFEDILEGAIEESLSEWGRIDVDCFFKATIAIRSLEGRYKKIENIAKISIINVFENFQTLPLENRLTGDGVLAALDICIEHRIVNAIIKCFDGYVSFEYKDSDIWFSELEKVCSSKRISDELQKQPDDKFRLPIRVNEWIKFCKFFDRDETALIFNKFRSIAEFYELVEGFIESTGSVIFNEDNCRILRRAYTHDYLKAYVVPVAQLLQKYFVVSAKMDNDSTFWLFKTLIPISKKNADFAELLNNLIKTGHIHHLFHLALTSNQFNTASYLFLSILKGEGLVAPPVIGNSSAGFSLVQKLLTNPAEQANFIDEFSALIELLSEERLLIDLTVNNENTYKFVAVIFKKLSNKNKVYAKFSAKELSSEAHSFLTNILNNDLSSRLEIVKYWVSENNLIENLLSSKFSVAEAWLYSSIVEAKVSSPEFINKCRAGLHEITEKQWSDNIYVNTWLTRLSTLSEVNSGNLNLDAKLKNAILEMAYKARESASEIKIEKTRLNNLFGCLKAQEKYSLNKSIYEMVKNQEKVYTEMFWNLFSSCLVDYVTKSKNRSVILETILLSSIKNQDVRYMNLVDEILKKYPKVLDLTKENINQVRKELGVLERMASNQELKRSAKKLKSKIKISRSLSKK